MIIATLVILTVIGVIGLILAIVWTLAKFLLWLALALIFLPLLVLSMITAGFIL